MARIYVKKSDGAYVPQKLQSVTNIDIVQEKGDSQNKVMSQKAVTDAMTASDQKLSELELDSYINISYGDAIKNLYPKVISSNGDILEDSTFVYGINVYKIEEKNKKCRISGKTYSARTELAAFYNSDSIFDSSTLISIVPYAHRGNPIEVNQFVEIPTGAKQ